MIICLQCRRPGFNPCGEDPLEKEMETHSSILTWRTPWTEEPVGSQRDARCHFSLFSSPMSFNSATRPLATQFLEEKQRLTEMATFVRDHALPLYSWHSHSKAISWFESLCRPTMHPKCSKNTTKQGVNQHTHLVRQLEEPAARDIHVVIGSVAMVISWLAGFGATSSSLWGPHT